MDRPQVQAQAVALELSDTRQTDREARLRHDGHAEPEVKGWGYHDHQWGNIAFFLLWNNWTWARQSYDDYSMLVFDMTATAPFESDRFPLCFIQDKDGNLVFESHKGVTWDAPEAYVDEVSGKTYPKVQTFHFENGGKTVDYTLTADTVIERSGELIYEYMFPGAVPFADANR